MNLEKETLHQFLNHLAELKRSYNKYENHFDYEVIATFDAPNEGGNSPGTAVITKSWSPSKRVLFGKNHEPSETVLVISAGRATLHIPVDAEK